MKKIILLLCICLAPLMFNGCGASFTNLQPVDRAATIGIQLSDYYTSLYQQALYVNEHGSPDQHEFMRAKVNPIMNKAKDALVLYNMAILTWKTSGSEPVDLAQREKEIRDLLQQAATMIVEIIGEG